MSQDGHPVPGVAQAAIQQGRFVGHLIANRARGRKNGRPFRYWNKGNMAVVGKNFAILEAGWLRTGDFLTLAGLGGAARAFAAAVPEPVSRADAVVLVVPDRATQLAPDFRSAATAGIAIALDPDLGIIRWMRRSFPR